MEKEKTLSEERQVLDKRNAVETGFYMENKLKEAIKRLTPQLFHEVYEEVAMRVGWETNKKCKVKFDDLPETNQETMITTIRLIKDKIFGEELSK